MRVNAIRCLLLLLIFVGVQSWAATKVVRFQAWSIGIDSSNGDVTVLHGTDTLLYRSNAVWGADNRRTAMSQAKLHRIQVSDNSDSYGEGKLITLRATHLGQQVEQRIYLYGDRPFLHTELEVSSAEGVSLNYMAPLCTSQPYTLLDAEADAHSLFVPFDNDAFIRYRSIAFATQPTESYGVTAFFDATSRRGMVMGAIDHTTWKTGIGATTARGGVIRSLRLYGGASSVITRDKLPHGHVVGARVCSPRMMVGMYDDWREGMESFADQCATFAPGLPSLGARPFGWNSWGALATKVTFQKSVEVSDFIHSHLQSRGFENEGTVYVDIDSFWDFGFRAHEHRIFVEHCHANNQKAGIYWCPFTDWSGNPRGRVVPDMDYRWEDVYIRANGEPVKFDGGIALDPTHPAVRRRIELQLGQFLEWGYEYVKLDFMAHGAYQSDSYYDASVTTAMQAYNQGMQHIVEQSKGRMWINLSIAPLFPGNYAHSRRISCDAWSDIRNTEYVLNSLTYGWWLDHIYHYNDADHIVYKGVSEGENRARVTSSAITGIYFLGDDMSRGGSADVKAKVVRHTTNRGINEIARTCKSFRPVEVAYLDRGADTFYHSAGGKLYVAMFNYHNKPAVRHLQLERVGLAAGREYEAEELWSGERLKLQGEIKTSVGGKDVKVFCIKL